MTYLLHIGAFAGLGFAYQAAWSPEWLMISTIIGGLGADLIRIIMRALP